MGHCATALLWASLSLNIFNLPSAAADSIEARGAAPKSTYFNGQEVPPLLELNGATYKEQISSGHWFIKAFSPWCGHCTHFAPKWQTLYEFYYTSDPVPASNQRPDAKESPKNFTKYFDFHFASIDCVAFGTACTELGAHAWPTIVLLKDGKEIKNTSGDRSIKEVSDFLESGLETIKPGSRPTGGIEVPDVGVNKFMSKMTIMPGKLGPSAPNDIPPKQLGPIRPTNPDGISFEFTPETFEQLQKKTLDPWLVKFYAPWCPHCKKMAPTWASMAREMKGKLNVGEVNCDVEKVLCREWGVSSYPTILFFRGPEHVEYEGLRGLGDFVDYANQAVAASSVKTVNGADFAELEKTEEVIFIYFYDHATTSEDFMALERLPLHLIGRGKIVKTGDADLARRFNVLTWPRLLVSKDGQATVYDQLAPQDMRNVEKIRDWMQSVWHPLVPEISASNAQFLMNDKLVVLGILSRQRKEEFAVAKREIKNAALEWSVRQGKAVEAKRKGLRNAKQLRIEEAEDKGDKRALQSAQLIHIDTDSIQSETVTFAWIDGVFWERWIRSTYGISVSVDGEKVVINDQANRRYWDTTSAGNPIVPSRTSILETLSLVYADPDKLPSKPTDSRFVRFFRHSSHFVAAHPWLATIGGSAAVLVALTTSIKVRRRRRRSFGSAGFFKLEEKAGSGSGANGKVD